MKSILKVLILEDIHADATMMEHELKKANIKFDAKIVQTENDFLNELNFFKPDIILSDYRLPSFNGLEALEIVRKVSPETPFIIVTGTLDEITAANCIKKGAWDYVLKDNLVRLGSAVQEAMKLKEEIDKRKIAEQAQQEIEQQYREIFNSSTDAFLIFDMRGNIKEANPQACKMYGYKYKELIKLSGKDIVHPDYYHVFKNFKIEVRIEGEFYTESVDVHKDGTFFDVEVKGAKINFKGKPHLLSIVRDITERKQAEEVLRKSEEQYRDLVERGNIAIVVDDIHGNIIYFNNHFLNLFGYSAEEIKSTTHKIFIHPDDFEMVSKYHKKRLEGKETPSRYEFRGVRKDGSIINIEIDVCEILKKEGKFSGTRSYLWDITKRKETEEKLQESEKRYRDLFELSPDPIVVHEQGIVLAANKAAADFMRTKSPEELIGNKVLEFVHPDYKEMVLKRIKKISQENVSVKRVREKFINLKNEIRDVEVTAKPIIFENKKAIMVVFRDITERIKADKKIRESEDKIRNFINTTTIGIWCFKPESPIDITLPVEKQIDEFMKSVCIECNETYAAMMGTSKNKIIGIILNEVLPDNEENREYFRKFIKKGYKLDGGESHEISKTGEEKYFSNSFTASIIDNKITEAWGVQTDITERKQVERKLKKNEQFLNSILESVQDGVSVLNPDLTIRHVNEKINEWYKENLPLEGKKCYEAYHNADKPCEPCPTLRCFESGKTECNIVPGLPGGSVEWIELFSYPIKDSNSGKITGVVEFVRDITERKRAEETKKVLYNIAHAICTTKTLDELYKTIHLQLGKIIDATNFYVALYDKENETILFPYHIDEKDKYTSYPARKTLTAYVIRTGKSLLGTEEVIEQLIEAGEIGKGKKGTRTKIWVGVPLIVDNVAIGAIAVQSYTDASIYSEKDLEILEFISDEIALAIKHKQAEQALKHEKDFYHSFIESFSDWVWEIDIQGIYTYSNKTVEDILGYEVDEIVGFSVKKVWSKEQKNKFDKWYKDELKSGKGWKNFTAYFQHKDGSIRILESTAIPIYDTENKLVGYRGIDHDITSRIQALQKIQESEEKYRTLTDNLNVTVYRSMAYDKNKLIEINPAFVKMFGYKSKDEIKKLKVSSLYQNSKERKHFVKKIAKNDFVKNEELVLKRKDGSQFIGSVSAVLVRDKEGTELYIDGFIEDITERKKAEEALQKSNKELRRLHKELEGKVKKAVEELRDKDHILIHQSRQASMGEMIGNIAHQWRQPLSAVAAIIQNYEDAYEDGKLDMDYIEEHTDLIMDILQQMSRTIDDFRNFFKPNKLKVDFNIKEVVLKTIKFLETSIKFNNIKLILNLPDDCIITGFPNEYSQVILVILNNAKDALLERKIKEKQIEINLEKEKNRTILKITDNAGGIDAKVMDNIFNPYFTTKEDKGTGVGLYMSKMIIEKNMKGKLSFGNTKKGAEFKIEI